MTNLKNLRLQLRRTAAAIAIASTLGGCINSERQFYKQTDKGVTAKLHQVTPNAAKSVVYLKRPVYADAPTVDKNGIPLPGEFEKEDFTLRMLPGLTLREISNRITDATGIPVDIDDMPIRDGAAGKTTISVADATTDDTTTALLNSVNPSGGGLAPPPASPTNGARVSAAHTKTVDRIGPLSRTLRDIEHDFDVEYKFDGRRIVLTGTTTEILHVKAPPTSSEDVTDTLQSAGGSSSGTGGTSGSSSSGSGSTGGGNDSITTNAKYDIWTDLDDQLKKMTGGYALYSISKTTGTVTVTGRPNIRHRVADFIDRINKILSVQVKIEVALILVQVNDNDTFGLNLNTLFSNPASGFQAGIGGLVPALAQAAGATQIGIINPPAGSSSAHFATTQAVLQASSTAARLADYETGAAIVQNNIPTPIDLSTDQDVVKSIKIQTVAQAGATSTDAESTTINYGFTAQIIPRIIDDSTVDLFAKVTSNDLANIQPFAVGNNESLQLVTLTKRRLKNSLILASGQTLVAAGYEQMKTNDNNTGRGTPEFMLFGGQSSQGTMRTRLIMVLTPTVLPDPTPGQEILAK